MPEQVKVFQNIVDLEVSPEATTQNIVSTTSTTKAVISDIDAINLGRGATLEQDGHVLQTSNNDGSLQLNKSILVDNNSTVSFKFPLRPSTGLKGLFFCNGSEGLNTFTTVNGYLNPEVKSVSETTGINIGTSGFVHVHGVTSTIKFYKLCAGVVTEYDEDGVETDEFSFGATNVHQMCTDGTYMYAISSASTVLRRHIDTGIHSDFSVTGGLYMPAHNQGSYTLHHNGKIYSKTSGGGNVMSYFTIPGPNDPAPTPIDINNVNLAVGGYSDGACVVTNTLGESYIVEQGTNYFTYYNISTGVVSKIQNGSQSSTEYGNGAFEAAPGVALIFGEHNDRLTVIDMNESPPAWTTSQYPNNPYSLGGNANTFGNQFGVAAGIVPIAPRKFSSYIAGVNITE